MASENIPDEIGRPYSFNGFVILNHVGGIWGPTVYDSPEEAYAYIDRWQKDNPGADLSRHRVVPGYSLTFAFALARKDKETGE